MVILGILVLATYSSYKLGLYKFVTGYYELKKELIPISTLKDTLPSEFILIAHAGGGLAGKTYLNTLEALDQSIKLGYKFIEIDINSTRDSVYVLSHDFVDMTANRFLSNKTNGTHLSLHEFLEWLKNKDVKIVTDTKLNTTEVLSIIRHNYPHLIKKIIPQVYFISEINIVRKMGFINIIFTNYLYDYPSHILMKIAETKSLFGITVPYTESNLAKLAPLIKDSETPFFTHTINTQDQKIIAQKSGMRGVYTDFIYPGSDK